LAPFFDPDPVLDGFPGRRLLVVGDLMLDRYLDGRVDRISPEAPVPVVSVSSEGERTMPGGAANVAMNIRSLGGSATLVGLVGDDTDGDVLKSLLSGSGLSCEGVVTDRSRPTTTKTRIMCRSHQILRVDREVCDPAVAPASGLLRSFILDSIGSVDAVVFQDYDKGVMDGALIREVTRAALAAGMPVAVDPKFRNFYCYEGCSLFKPNRPETARILGREIPDTASAMAAAAELVERLGAGAVMVTLGEEGSVTALRGGGGFHRPTFARRIFDVSGAGDAVISVMSLCLASGVDLETAATISNHAAAAVCARPGVHAVTPGDIRKECREYYAGS
jgi:rfaE bifunctional protein kinase chain/domain